MKYTEEQLKEVRQIKEQVCCNCYYSQGVKRPDCVKCSLKQDYLDCRCYRPE